MAEQFTQEQMIADTGEWSLPPTGDQDISSEFAQPTTELKAVSFDIATARADKYAFNKTPTERSQLADMIAAGQESVVRQAVAAQKEQDDRVVRLKQANDAVRAGAPLDQSLLEATKPVSVDTVLEKKFGEDYAEDYFSKYVPIDALIDDMTKDRAKKEASRVSGLYAYANKLKEDIDQEYKDMSWLQFGADVVGPAIAPWAWTAVRSRNAFGPSGGLLPGSHNSEQHLKYYMGDPDKSMADLKTFIDDLKKTNLVQAKEYLDGLVKYTDVSSALDTIFFGLDAATAPGVGLATKLAKGAVKGSAGRLSDIPVQQASAGQQLKAAQTAADTAHATGVVDETTLMNSLPLIADPTGIARGRAIFNPEASRRIIEGIEEANRVMAGLVDNLSGQQRLVGQEARQRALEEATDIAARQYSYSANRFVEARPAIADNGTEYASILLGDKNAVGFASKEAADTSAKSELNLVKGSYQVTELNPGEFYIDIHKPLDTRSFGALNALKADVVDQSPKAGPASWLRSPEYMMDKALLKDFKFQGVKASKALKDYRELMSPFKVLKKDEIEGLEGLINWQATVAKNSKTGKVGRQSETFEEFAQDYYQVNKRAPTEREAEAYFRAAVMHEQDYYMRNLVVRQSKESLGLQEHRLNLRVGGVNAGIKVEGKVAKQAPWHEPIGPTDFYRAVRWTGDSDSLALQRQATIGRFSDKATRDLIDAEIKAGSLQVVQISEEGARAFRASWKQLYDEDFGGPVTHILVPTGKFTSTNLPVKQIPKRSGWHIELPDDGVMLSQPKVTQHGPRNARYNVYEGDSNLHYVPKGTDPTKLVEDYNKMLSMLRDMKKMKDPNDVVLARAAVDAFIKTNLPFKGLDEVSTMIRRGHVKVDQPVAARPMNSRLKDVMDVKPQDGREFFDGMDNYFNIYSGDDTLKYAMKRNDPISSVADVGSQQNPVYKFVPTPQVNFGAIADRTMGSLINSTAFTALKTRAVTEWATEFASLFDTELTRLQRNPYEALVNFKPTEAQLKGQRDLVNRAMLARRQILELTGMKSDFNKSVDAKVGTLVDKLFSDKGLGRFSDKLSDPPAWATLDDATHFTRNVAFHPSIGLLNPVQFFLNMSTMINISAISGIRHGGPATMAGFSSLSLRFNSKPQMVQAMDKAMTKLGWKQGDFADSYNAMKKVGWNDVGSNHAYRDTLDHSPAIQSKTGEVLDAAAMFFRRSEQLLRETSWFSAWSEHRAKFPHKVFGEKDYKEIMQRADVLTVNMTSTSNATWQRGVLGIATQFMSYQARLTEQFLNFGANKSLTAMEKARLFTAYSAIYGVPAGGLGASLGVFGSYHEFFDRKLRENGVEVDSNAVYRVLNEGLMAPILEGITGREWDTSRLSPSGNSFIHDFFFKDEKSLLESLGGPGLSVMGTVANALVVSPTKLMLNMVPGLSNGDVSFVEQDMLDVLQSFGSGKAINKLIYANKMQAFVDKRGAPLTDATKTDAMISAMLGVMPKEIKTFREQLYSTKVRNEYIKEMTTEFNKYYALGLKETDEAKSEAYLKRAQAILAGLDPMDQADVWRKGTIRNIDPIRKMNFKFSTQTQERLDAARDIRQGKE